MYEPFFGLSRRPFASAADVDCYFPAASIEAARQTLYRTIDRGEGPALLVGPAGVGKSLLLMVLAEQFAERFSTALLTNGRVNTRRELLQAILYELGLACRELEEGELRLSLIDYLSRPQSPAVNFDGSETTTALPRDGLLLLIDEAHLLSYKLLEEVRLITNFIRGGQPKVRLVLAGSPLLEERFTSPKLEAFNQRIVARCYVQALDREETRNYVKAQIDWAGGRGDRLFTAEALDAAYQATQGVPRLINQVCDHALLLACAAGEAALQKSNIEEAWADLQQLPTPWNRESAETTTASPDATVIEFGVLDDEPDCCQSVLHDDSEKAATVGSDPDSVVDEAIVDIQVNESIATDDPMSEMLFIGDAEDDWAAVPFPGTGFSDDTDAQNPLGRLAHVEEQLSAIDIEARHESLPQSHFALADPANPFSETFAEEEVILDPFAMTAADALANRPLVRSEEGRRLGAMLRPLPDRPLMALAVATADTASGFSQDDVDAEPVLRAIDPDGTTTAWPLNDEPSDEAISEPALIVIEDDPPAEHQVTVVRREEFGEIFDNLRGA
jgi:type II secretory pathway predicted ATPase ExeA